MECENYCLGEGRVGDMLSRKECREGKSVKERCRGEKSVEQRWEKERVLRRCRVRKECGGDTLY